MAVANEKAAGTSYRSTVALILAFIFIPAVLIVSHPFGDLALAVTVASSAICIGLARIDWMKSSQLSMASITYRGMGTK